jgi:hypothetical protein
MRTLESLSLTPSRVVLPVSVLCSISDDRGYLSCRAGMWAGYELSVTRALGHKHLGAYGVLCEPTVTTMTLQPDDACLVSHAVFRQGRYMRVSQPTRMEHSMGRLAPQKVTQDSLNTDSSQKGYLLAKPESHHLRALLFWCMLPR